MQVNYDQWWDEAFLRVQDSIRMRVEAEQGKGTAPEKFADLARKLASSAVKLAIMKERKVPAILGLPNDVEQEIELLTLAAGKYARRHQPVAT